MAVAESCELGGGRADMPPDEAALLASEEDPPPPPTFEVVAGGWVQIERFGGNGPGNARDT